MKKKAGFAVLVAAGLFMSLLLAVDQSEANTSAQIEESVVDCILATQFYYDEEYLNFTASNWTEDGSALTVIRGLEDTDDEKVKAIYPIADLSPGEYDLWLHVSAEDADSDAGGAAIDDFINTGHDALERWHTNNQWDETIWIKVGTFSTLEQPAVVLLGVAEEGPVIGEVLITQETDETPAGHCGDLETASDNDSGSNNSGNGNSSDSNTSGNGSNTASGDDATVGGGRNNTASGDVSTISGGEDNTADGEGSTIGGGAENVARGVYDTIAGGWRNEADGEFEGEGNSATVGGGNLNFATSGGTVAGGGGNNAEGWYSTIGGGIRNAALGFDSTIGGGRENEASGAGSTIDGGRESKASGFSATVGGGYGNEASGIGSTIAGGGGFFTGTDLTEGPFVEIFPGSVASGNGSTVGGGSSNLASGDDSTIAGGAGNTASGLGSTVGGGGAIRADIDPEEFDAGEFPLETLLPGNTASGEASTVSGGSENEASGRFAAIPGGAENVVRGDYSFVAGRRAKVDSDHDGAILFADSSDVDFKSEAANEFAARATGGVRFVTAVDGDGNPTAGVELPAGSGSWASLSDASAKANFASVDVLSVLERLSEVPIGSWSYKSQDPDIRHIGPSAQDFYAAFGLGESERRISVVDADGIALAAIQGLYALIQEKNALTEALQEHNSDLEARIEALEKAVNTRSMDEYLFQFTETTR